MLIYIRYIDVPMACKQEFINFNRSYNSNKVTVGHKHDLSNDQRMSNWKETNKIIHIYSFVENISVHFESKRERISFQLKNIRPLLTPHKGSALGRHRVPKSFNSFNNRKLFLDRKINITTNLFLWPHHHTETTRKNLGLY